MIVASALTTDPRIKICKKDLERDSNFQQFSRGCEKYKAHTLLDWAQPWIAWIILVFAFTSAAWWDTPVTFSKVAVAYAAVSPFQY